MYLSIQIIIVNVFVLMGCSLLPNTLRRSKIYCAPPNLLRGLFFQAWGSLTNLKSQTWDTQLKLPPGGLVLRIFTSWKNQSTSVGFEAANLGSRGEHVTPRPPKSKFRLTSTIPIPPIYYVFKNIINFNHYITV